MKLFLPIICYNHLCNTEHMMSLMRLLLLLKEAKIDVASICISFDSLVSRGRNAAAAFFLSDPDATHMMFIDTDIEFDPNEVLRMLGVDKDVVAAYYPHKYINLSYLGDAIQKGAQDPLRLATHVSAISETPLPSGLQKAPALINVEYAPTGFMLIKRCVLEKLAGLHPERNYKNDIDGYMSADQSKFFDFFRVSVNPSNKKYESEDYGFCSLWRDAGGHVSVLTDVNLTHYGWYGYRGNLATQWEFRSAGK
jgi:hypothetical protein